MRCLLLILFSLLFAAPASAQTCGLPTSGTITADATYALTADCTQTGALEIPSSVTSAITLTINGNTHKISMGTGLSVPINFIVDNGGGLNHKIILNNVTFDGQSQAFTLDLLRGGIGTGILSRGTLTASKVTFTNGSGNFLQIVGTATLNDVLFLDNSVRNHGFSASLKGAALHVSSTGIATLNKAVFRNNSLTNVVVEKGGSLSTTGCLTFSGNLTHNVIHSKLTSHAGTWIDKSEDEPCSGNVGNGGQSVYPSASPDPCGMPKSGFIESNSVFTLKHDCVGLKIITLTEGVSVTIRGMERRMANGEGAPAQIRVGGLASLTIEDATLDNVRLVNLHGTITMNNAMFTNAQSLGVVNYGRASFSNSMFENNIGHPVFSSVYYGDNSFGASSVRFSRATFRGNNGGPAVLKAVGQGSAITIGCDVNFKAPVALGTTSDAPAGTPTAEPQKNIMVEDGASVRHMNCLPPPRKPCLPEKIVPPTRRALGAIGVIFYMQKCPAVIEIWEVMPDSQGKFALEVSQNDVEAVAQGLVACSSDGRAAVRVGLTEPVRQKMAHSQAYQAVSPRKARDIQISLGPNVEGKVLHLVIDNALGGGVLGFVDTSTGDPPCQGASLSSLLAVAPALPQPTPIPYASPVTPQPADEDGSIVHVVQSGDTIWQIGIAYNVHPYRIISQNNLNELTSQGAFIFPGQKLLIRPAQ